MHFLVPNKSYDHAADRVQSVLLHADSSVEELYLTRLFESIKQQNFKNLIIEFNDNTRLELTKED